MKCKTVLVTFSLLLTFVTISSCKKENDLTSDDDKFCEFVNSGDFDATGLLIDNFLASLDNGNEDKDLINLRTGWKIKVVLTR